jgi:hypothetical protein
MQTLLTPASYKICYVPIPHTAFFLEIQFKLLFIFIRKDDSGQMKTKMTTFNEDLTNGNDFRIIRLFSVLCTKGTYKLKFRPSYSCNVDVNNTQNYTPPPPNVIVELCLE